MYRHRGVKILPVAVNWKMDSLAHPYPVTELEQKYVVSFF